MKDVFLSTLILTVVYAATNDEGNVCNYPLTGQEMIHSAVPISGFRTSGNDFIRPAWCITHCKDRKSIKAALNFKLSNSSSSVFSIHSKRLYNGKAETDYKLVKGQKLDDDDDSMLIICYQNVAKVNEVLFSDFSLNYYVNKEGWAFLVYELGPPPSMVATDNAQQDPNFCMKTVTKQNITTTNFYQVFAGLIEEYII
uniref:Salivary lipocalin n=1 Tax=Heterorhabditis bacteriophora TaxID=37862 RepID=A0A1I7WKA4_HETBA